MDKKTISIILDQNLETVKSFIEMMITGVKKEVETLRKENQDLRNSLQFSQGEIDDLKTTVRLQSEEIKTMRLNTEKTAEVAERVRRLDDMSRRNNIRIEVCQNENLKRSSKHKFKWKRS